LVLALFSEALLSQRVFVTGGTGYIGSRLIPILAQHGHEVIALVRPGSERRLPGAACRPVLGDALDGASYLQHLRVGDTFIQLVGVPHPSPAKKKEFVAIDQRSGMEAILAAKRAGVGHFIYVSVAHPAPAMHAYIAARSACEAELRASGLNATILRPWYVLGPGHRWPYALLPFYWLAERIPRAREGARRLGLLTVEQMLKALARAVDRPPAGVEVMDVSAIRAAE
jgi:uncharacterized protein YbjT (DUF2867 family)